MGITAIGYEKYRPSHLTFLSNLWSSPKKMSTDFFVEGNLRKLVRHVWGIITKCMCSIGHNTC